MKTMVNALSVLLASCLVALTAWLAQLPAPAQAVREVPAKYRDTVQRGLEYLVKYQAKDGHWEGDDGKHPVAMTALVGMALLMEGSTTQKGKYSTNIRMAVDWLVDKSKAGRNGLIFSDHPSEIDRYMYGHGLATMFLAWDFNHENGRTRTRRDREILTSAAKYIVNAQSTERGWYRTSRAEGHDFTEILATAVQIQALQVVTNFVDIEVISVRGEAVTDAQEYLRLALEKYEKDNKTKRANSRFAETAAALACRSTLGGGKDNLCTNWCKYCKSEIAITRGIQFGRDELAHFYYAQAVHNDSLDWTENRSADWAAYRTATFDQLQSSQNKDGSWPAGDGISVGTVYSTALWCTVLQLDTKRHPLTREPPRAIF